MSDGQVLLFYHESVKLSADEGLLPEHLSNILRVRVVVRARASLHEIGASSSRLLLLELADNFRKLRRCFALVRISLQNRGVSKGRCRIQHLLGAQVAEVSILENVVLIGVHIGVDLEENVAVHPQFEAVTDVGKICECDGASRADVEGSERS